MEKYTDQTFFYKQTPVNYDGIAKFTSIKGNTLGWNQLVQNGNFANTNGWNPTRGTITVNNNICQFTATETGSLPQSNRINYPNITPLANHSYLVSAYIKTPRNTVGSIGFTQIDYWPIFNLQANIRTKVSTIYTFGTASTSINLGIGVQANANDVVEISNVQMFDLTQMGLDISSPSEFPFGLPYYDYNQGTLIPFSGNGIKTTGKNQVLQTISGYTDTTKITMNTATRSAIFYAIKGVTYTISSSATMDRSRVALIPNGIVANNAPIENQKNLGDSVRTWRSDWTGLTIWYCCNSNQPLFDETAQIEIGSTPSDYEPYTSTTTDLPISTYFPTGMKSAGNVYDELTPSKAITRVGAVDLGTLTWEYQSGNTRFNANGVLLNLAKLPSSNNEVANILCAKYATASSNNTASASYNMSVGLSTNGNIQIRDTNFTDATAFKNSLQGVYLYYELATETETDAEDIFYKFYADGTEQLLPVNGSSPETSPIIADIEYYDSTEGDSLYRRFWLINGDGERWDLTDKEFRSFLNNPTGLGFRKTIEVTRYGEKANKNNEVYDFPQPSGELLFYDTYNSTRYDKYNKFIRFLMSQPITLYYMIPVSYISGIANIFTLDCDVTEVQKTESKTDHILTSSIVFNGLGFYEGDEISVNGTTDTYTLTNEGDFPVGFEITIEGSLTNPYVTLSQDGELYGEAKFDSETAFNSLYLNSNDGEQNVILQQGGSVIPNPLSYQDLSISNGSIYVTFVKLAKGVSELSIGVESGSITNVNIKYSPKYRSV